MKYRLLGKSGLRVSEAALGAMTFGDEWGWGSPNAEAQKVYETYREAGGNFIDTANSTPMAQAGPCVSSRQITGRTTSRWECP